MLPNQQLTQQQLLVQMLQLQQMQQMQQAQKQLPTDLMALYQQWLFAANFQQQLNLQQSLMSLQQQQQPQISTPPITSIASPFLHQQQLQSVPATPSPSLSPSDNKRKAMTLINLLEAAPAPKKICPETPLTPSPLITTTPCLPTSSSTSSSSRTTPALTTANDNNSDTAPASINSRSESGSISDGEPDEFIDVVGEEVPKTKAQRKAHIEFYRKLKLLRNREKKLKCALCDEVVKNIETNVRTHIASHAETSMLICKICCFSSGDLHQMFEHMGAAHPNHRTCYEDRRNMTQLSELLSSCFPRGGVGSKQRSGFVESVAKVLEVAKQRGEGFVNCAVCEKDIQATKEVLTRHMNAHHVYRCKKCKTMLQVEEEMQAHCSKSHKIEAPKSGSDYHITASADAVGCIFKKCFETYLKSPSSS